MPRTSNSSPPFPSILTMHEYAPCSIDRGMCFQDIDRLLICVPMSNVKRVQIRMAPRATMEAALAST